MRRALADEGADRSARIERALALVVDDEDSGRWELREAAHALVGAARLVGLPALEGPAHDLESLAVAGASLVTLTGFVWNNPTTLAGPTWRSCVCVHALWLPREPQRAGTCQLGVLAHSTAAAEI